MNKTGPLWLFTLLLAGCGGTGDLSGRVSLDGKPLVLGTVTFFSNERGPQTAVIQADGSYEMNEVPIGEAKISVSSADPRPKPGRRRLQPIVPMGKDGKRDPNSKEPPSPHPAYTVKQLESWFPIPERYRDPARSRLSVDVKSGPQVFDVELMDEQ